MKEKVLDLVNNLEGELVDLSSKIYAHPELGYEEFKSSALHVEILEKYGFKVESNYLDISTAFRAEYSSIKIGVTI